MRAAKPGNDGLFWAIMSTGTLISCSCVLILCLSLPPRPPRAGVELELFRRSDINSMQLPPPSVTCLMLLTPRVVPSTTAFRNLLSSASRAISSRQQGVVVTRAVFPSTFHRGEEVLK